MKLNSLMERGGTVYIMTNKKNGVLYVGVTARFIPRIIEHRTKKYPKSFTARYNLTRLVYYHSYGTIMEAILEEKRIKGGSRVQKIKLIEGMNPGWDDLWETEVSKW
jgi:putative endonuclease